MNATLKGRRQEISFTVQTIDCIACTPVFRRSLERIHGVLEVRELPITNKIIVAFDGAELDREVVVQEICRVSQKAGFGGKIIVHEVGRYR